MRELTFASINQKRRAKMDEKEKERLEKERGEKIERERRRMEEMKEEERAAKARARQEKRQMQDLAEAEQALTEAVISGNLDAIILGHKKVGHALFELGQHAPAADAFQQAKQIEMGKVEETKTPCPGTFSSPSISGAFLAKSTLPSCSGGTEATSPSASEAASRPVKSKLSRELFPVCRDKLETDKEIKQVLLCRVQLALCLYN